MGKIIEVKEEQGMKSKNQNNLGEGKKGKGRRIEVYEKQGMQSKN